MNCPFWGSIKLFELNCGHLLYELNIEHTLKSVYRRIIWFCSRNKDME